jgi:uncharacterized membrane protein (UPF0127 family)
MDLGFELKLGEKCHFFLPMRFSPIVASALVLLCACREEPPAQAPAVAAPQQASTQPPAAPAGAPQPKLPTVKLWVGASELTAEIASTVRQIQTGMMWRTNMAEMEAMLFVFPLPQSVSFYMRNTLLPLSCGYIDANGTLLEIYDMKPRDETPIPSASSQIQYVLEVNQGWFERHNVRTGMVFTTQYGPFRDTFVRRR